MSKIKNSMGVIEEEPIGSVTSDLSHPELPLHNKLFISKMLLEFFKKNKEYLEKSGFNTGLMEELYGDVDDDEKLPF